MAEEQLHDKVDNVHIFRLYSKEQLFYNEAVNTTQL